VRLFAFLSLAALSGCQPSAATISPLTEHKSHVDVRAAEPTTGDASPADANSADADSQDAGPKDAGSKDVADAAAPIHPLELKARLRARADEVLAALKAQDTVALADLSDPARGVRFSPYSFIDVAHDVVLSREQIRNAMNDSHVRTWGTRDGKGDPISETFRSYYKHFVWTGDFTKAPKAGIDRSQGTGNETDNISKAYPHAHFVELYFPADEKSGGMNWTSLRLVFEEGKIDGGSALWLVGIIHGQWTI
jgi:hypothetical protein